MLLALLGPVAVRAKAAPVASWVRAVPVVPGVVASVAGCDDAASQLELDLKVQLYKIGEAVKSTVPQEMWGEIIEKLDEAEQHQEALNVGADSFDDDDDEPFDPTEFIDEDDEF